MCCSVLQCVAACVLNAYQHKPSSVSLLCVAVYCSVLQCVAACVLNAYQRLALKCLVVVCWSVLQCVAVCCSVLQRVS